MKNILEMGVASKKIDAIVTEVQLISVLRPDKGLQEKIVLSVTDNTTKVNYRVSDAWVDYKDELTIRALWFFESPDGIYADSTLASAMKFYNVTNLKDFIGKTVKLYPDKNEYLTLVLTENI